jgi:prepilin-type N-terminal cleavage/methylation domain-containing protein
MTINKTDERGFTLIEVIVTLVLVGITAALAGMWIVSITNGYIFAKNNMDTTQKAQLAMTRLVKEFKTIRTVTSSSASSITYNRPDLSDPAGKTQTIALSGTQLQINSDTLTDKVNAFSLSYCANVTDTVCSTTWTSTSRIIVFTLTLAGADNVTSTFTERAAPTNL